jgi:hypothetical protein
MQFFTVESSGFIPFILSRASFADVLKYSSSAASVR